MSQILGLDKLSAQLDQIANLDLVSAETEALNVIADEARLLVPVKTGDLRATIRVEAGELLAGGEGVDYALAIEMGTSNMAAQPFMRPAIDAKKDEAVRAAARNIETQIKRIA